MLHLKDSSDLGSNLARRIGATLILGIFWCHAVLGQSKPPVPSNVQVSGIVTNVLVTCPRGDSVCWTDLYFDTGVQVVCEAPYVGFDVCQVLLTGACTVAIGNPGMHHGEAVVFPRFIGPCQGKGFRR